jgi:ABC-2 type transport system permease protein
MLRSVYGEAIWSRRASLLLYGLGLALLVGITVGVYPTVRADSATFVQLLESMPKGMMSFLGSSDVSELLSPAGFINSRVNASIGAVVLAVFAISLGTAAIAGEEDRRTMDLLLATPTPRRSVVIARFGAMSTLIGIVAGVVALVILVANPIVDLELSVLDVLASNVELALLALVFGSLAFAVGGLTGRRGLTIGVTAGVTVAAFFVNGLAPLVGWLEPPQKITPFYWLQRSDPLANGLSIEDTVIMVAVIVVLMAIAVWGFERRDITV